MTSGCPWVWAERWAKASASATLVVGWKSMGLLYGWRMISVWNNLLRVESIPLNSGVCVLRCAARLRTKGDQAQQLAVMSLSSSPLVVLDDVEEVVDVVEVVVVFFFFDFFGSGSGGLMASSTIVWILS